MTRGADLRTQSPGQASAPSVGTRALRKEDDPLLRGAGAFVDDLREPGTLEAAFLRSPYPHAILGAIDSTAAEALDGVVAVYTAADLPGGGPPIPMRMFIQPGMERFLQPPLASDRVRYVGEPVAVVVATSRYVAEDALELIDVEYEPLEAVVDHDAAAGPDAPLLHPAAGTNVAATFTTGDDGLDGVFESAETVVAGRFSCGRHGAVPMEPRGLIAQVASDGRLVVHGAAKIVHVNRRILAKMLGWPEERIRFIEPHVGGGFGARGEFYPEDFVIPFCAIELGRPVAWTEDREEHLRSCNHSRDQHYRLELALGPDGEFLALRGELVMNTGAYVRTHGSVVPGMGAGLLPGPYAWPAFACAVRQVVTNKTPAGTYRAPGRYEGTFARERIIDIAARTIGADPIELRMRNLVRSDQMPWPNHSQTDGHDVVYDSGDYAALVGRAIERFDVAGLRRWRDEPGAGIPRRRGVALALFVEKSGIAEWEYARVTLTTNGRALVHSGSASLGQGVETVLAQICSDALEIPYEQVDVAHGDTDTVPEGMGSFGSRATSLGGAAVAEAAAALRTRIADRVAARTGEPAEGLVFTDDGVVSGDDVVYYRDLLEPGEAELSEEARFRSTEMSFPYGAHVAAVEIDTETGAVDVARYGVAYDVGRAINPRLVEGQIEGGFAQGLGGALLEELAYDDQGQFVSGSFIDYLLPTSAEVPAVETLICEDAPTQRSPIGAKGAGEGGTTAAGAAIAGAVSDALGAEVMALPITPEWISGQIRSAA